MWILIIAHIKHTQLGHLPHSQQITSYLSILFCNPSHRSSTPLTLTGITMFTHTLSKHQVAAVGMADGVRCSLNQKTSQHDQWGGMAGCLQNPGLAYQNVIIYSQSSGGCKDSPSQWLLITAVWGSNFHSVSHFQCIITSRLFVEWTESANLEGNA